MTLYRISRWTDPGAAYEGLSGRRALTAMSVGWVSRERLERQMQLSARSLDAFLDSLKQAGVLQVREDGGGSIGVGVQVGKSAMRSLLREVCSRAHLRRAAADPSLQRPAIVRGLSHFEVHLIVEELGALLGRAAGARHVLADLARLERRLRLGGPAAVDALPEKTLRWALAQLKSLGPSGAQGCLGTLQRRLEEGLRQASPPGCAAAPGDRIGRA